MSPFVVPDKYELIIKTDFDPFASQPTNVPVDYTGQVAITFQLSSAMNTLKFHMDQSITLAQAVTLVNVDTNAVYSVQHSYLDEKVDLYQVQTSTGTNLPVGKYKLSLSFSSETKLDGFYKSNYIEFGTSR